MNYYEHHLGDYAKDTAHLSMLEHGAYRLLLDRYYGTEQGIPADQVHRVARARSKEEKQAVDVVLEEFFTLENGVWTNSRAEEEIRKFSEKKPRFDEKRENDKERQRRARERRKAIFEELSSLGCHMPYNATTDALYAELNRVKSLHGHISVTQPVTRDNTATQTPDTRHQTPESKQPPLQTEPVSHAGESEVAVCDSPIPDPPTQEGQWLSWFNREQGTQFDPASRFDRAGVWPVFSRWCKSGITKRQVSDAIREAHSTAQGPIANIVKYVDRVLENSQKPQQKMSHSDSSKLSAAMAIFGPIDGGTQHGQSGRIIDIAPEPAGILGG